MLVAVGMISDQTRQSTWKQMELTQLWVTNVNYLTMILYTVPQIIVPSNKIRKGRRSFNTRNNRFKLLRLIENLLNDYIF